EIEKNPLRAPGRAAAEKALKAVEAIRAEGDSAGGAISCLVRGVPPGLGDPVFGKLDARLAGAVLSIGAVKGIEFGAGFAAAGLRGSENNDLPAPPAGAQGLPVYKTNNSGGVLGGISTGQDIEFRAAFKPVPSIAKPQKALGRDGITDLVIEGRHDTCVVPRAVPVVEAMAALALADAVLLQRAAKS
ncbi:MAG: chorismate synthase, partial [Treponema sp.]|nr:chorismate synthase [Treponema sp.]